MGNVDRATNYKNIGDFPSEPSSLLNESLNSVEMAALQKTLEWHKKAIDILARD